MSRCLDPISAVNQNRRRSLQQECVDFQGQPHTSPRHNIVVKNHPGTMALGTDHTRSSRSWTAWGRAWPMPAKVSISPSAPDLFSRICHSCWFITHVPGGEFRVVSVFHNLDFTERKGVLRAAQKNVFYCLVGSILICHSWFTCHAYGVNWAWRCRPCLQRWLPDWVAPTHALLFGWL
jgi:hypothetical protein